MKPGRKSLAAMLLLLVLSIYAVWFGLGEEMKGARDMRFGIDIRGGVEAIFEPVGLDRAPTETEVTAARNIMESRLDDKNILDREVTADSDRGYVIVRFPWKSGETEFNPEAAIAELGEMANLTFRDEAGNIMLEGKDVSTSNPVESSQTGLKQYAVELYFTEEGAEKFADATGKLIGQRMGIFMDDTIISNPVVRDQITGGNAIIDGMESYEEAKELSDKINAGALPYSMATRNFSTISPSLGAAALDIMVGAGVAAFVLICVFMVVKYRLPGFVACLGLAFQTCLQLLAISVPQYTLTLPGIAGIILSLGMAVDANVIINERIGEELRDGASLKDAILAGYKRAYSSVMDGNITSAIVAAILMMFGSGPMLSFGYTLLAGIMINVVIGVYYSKVILLSLVKERHFSAPGWFCSKKEQRIYQFMKHRKVWLSISAIALLIGFLGLARNGVSLDTQFTGGTTLKYEIQEETDSEQLAASLGEELGRNVSVQFTREDGQGKQSMVVTFSGKEGISPQEQKQATDLISRDYGEMGAALSETYSVQPYIGQQALNRSMIAMGLAAVLITLYVWIRFSILSGLSAGLAAMAALVHDVLIVFAVFLVFAIPLNDAFVAVVLTIIGYSINDTIVIYDRIRENMRKGEGTEVFRLVDMSVSQSLSRSVYTSVTTVIGVLILVAVSWYYQIPSIFEFSLPMLFGIMSGCFSSVCIASILWALWVKKREARRTEEVEPDEA